MMVMWSTMIAVYEYSKRHLYMKLLCSFIDGEFFNPKFNNP